MSNYIDDVGSYGSYCGRYKCGRGKGKEEPCGGGLELEIAIKLVIFNIYVFLLFLESMTFQQAQILGFKYHSPEEKGILEKWLILGLSRKRKNKTVR